MKHASAIENYIQSGTDFTLQYVLKAVGKCDSWMSNQNDKIIWVKK